jgi:hypothetical protein
MKKYRINRRNRAFRPILIIITVVVLIIGAGFYHYYHNQSPVPSSILHKINFVIFYPKTNGQTFIEKNTFKYSKSLGQVSFIVEYDGQHITFAEEGSPDSFAADPNFYSQFTSSLNGYATFDTVNGSASLTKPTEVKHEVGVMNTKGTLLFAQSTTGNLSENAWKQLFNSLVYVQPN